MSLSVHSEFGDAPRYCQLLLPPPTHTHRQTNKLSPLSGPGTSPCFAVHMHTRAHGNFLFWGDVSLQRYFARRTLLLRPGDLPCLACPAPVRVKCQLSHVVRPLAAAPSGSDRNRRARPDPQENKRQSSFREQRQQPSRKSSLCAHTEEERALGEKRRRLERRLKQPGVSACCRSSSLPAFWHRALAAQSALARLWWNRKRCLVFR